MKVDDCALIQARESLLGNFGLTHIIPGVVPTITPNLNMDHLVEREKLYEALRVGG